MSDAALPGKLAPATLASYGALSMLAVLCLCAGLIGLTQPQRVPALAQASVAWPLIAVGAILECGAVAMLLNAVRAQRSRM